ncbi:hypothetical protein ACFL20_07285 [Spirochaetota bacterium]
MKKSLFLIFLLSLSITIFMGCKDDESTDCVVIIKNSSGKTVYLKKADIDGQDLVGIMMPGQSLNGSSLPINDGFEFPFAGAPVTKVPAGFIDMTFDVNGTSTDNNASGTLKAGNTYTVEFIADSPYLTMDPILDDLNITTGPPVIN